jgi:hypothetical protein
MSRISSVFTVYFKNIFRDLRERDGWRWSVVAVVAALLCLAGITTAARFGVLPGTALKFVPISAHAFGDAPFNVSATSASSGAVTYTVLSGPATLSGSMLTITGGGVVQLSAKQAAKGIYRTRTAQTSFSVSTATSQTMSFTNIGDVVKSTIASDTPNFLFIDSDGNFFLQNADSQYDTVPANHVWDFYAGADSQDPSLTLSKDNSQFDTQTMCEKGNPAYTVLYRVAGVTPGPRGYADGNFCDAIGVWVDPDTGNWYAIVHNELYPNIPRVDVISYAISKDHGKTWTLQAPIATSPYGLGNKKDFYYDYGEGDPRFVVDTSAGYFYLFYNSRIMTPSGSGFSSHEWEHVSRAPISKKMAPESWEKYYNGGWSRILGIDWTCDAAGSTPCGTGQIASSLGSNIGPDGDPTINQTFIQPISKQTAKDFPTYTNGLLHTASVSWDVYLGKYVAFAEDLNWSAKSGDYDDLTDTMKFYVSDDLSKQKWTYAGSVPYRNSSWYRWFVDPGNLTSSKTIGSSFLAYCSVNCSDPKNDSEYIKVSVALNAGTASPIYYSDAGGVNSATNTYSISHPNGSLPAHSGGNSWTFVPVPQDDGFFNIKQGKMYLGVSDGNAGRAWGASVSLSGPIPSTSGAPEMSRQQWYFEQIKAVGGEPTSTVQYRLINRYSGLALSFSGSTFTTASLTNAVTAPIRDWNAVSHDASAKPFRVWKVSDQELIFTAQSTPAD